MMPPPLHPHQCAALDKIQASREAGDTSGLIVLPTGTGKTALFVTHAQEAGGASLILVHRDELVIQTLRTAHRFWPDSFTGVIQGTVNQWADRDLFTGKTADLIVASVQSLHEKRLREIPRGMFRTVIADEAHHAVSPSWAAVLDYFTPEYILGVTATPDRLDGKGLCERFGDRPLYSYSLYRAIKDGLLANLEQLALETRTDLDDVGQEDGDFALGKLAAKVNTPERNRIVLKGYQQHGSGRRALGFAVDVKHCKALVEVFREAGVETCYVTGTTPAEERRKTLDDFAQDKYQVCWNVQVLTEGFDDPGISCLLMARPTMSRALYAQQVGRGLRKAPGKANCLVLDFADLCHRHKLMAAPDLLGRERPEQGEPQEREGHARQARPKPEVKIIQWRMKYVCPWPEMPSLAGYQATQDWQAAPAGDRERDYLSGLGLKVKGQLTAGEAAYLIDRAAELDAAFPAPATKQQEYFLKRKGAWADGLSRKQASKLIAKIKILERRGA